MTNWISSEESLKAIPLPQVTRTYCPIPHNVFIEELQEQLDKKNLQIISKKYLTNKNGLMLTGEYGLAAPDDMEVSMLLGFHNSYNKVLPAGLFAGLMVLVCQNGCYGLQKSQSYNKKHCTGSLDKLRTQIKIIIDQLPEIFAILIQEKEAMKQIHLSLQTIAQLVGDMYLNENIITDTQLSIIRHEKQWSKNFPGQSAWSLYNWITESLKNSNPKDYMNTHLKVHTYISNKLQLTNERRNLYGILETVQLPTFTTIEDQKALEGCHQIDLEEAISEVKEEKQKLLLEDFNDIANGRNEELPDDWYDIEHDEPTVSPEEESTRLQNMAEMEMGEDKYADDYVEPQLEQSLNPISTFHVDDEKPTTPHTWVRKHLPLDEEDPIADDGDNEFNSFLE